MQMPRRARATTVARRRPLGFGPVVVGVSACSGSDGAGAGAGAGDGDGDGAIPPAGAESAVETVESGPDFVPTPDSEVDGDDGTTTTEFDLAAQPTTPPIEPVPETGVPGIESDDAFCRAWSEFAGSFQALALVSAIGDPAAALRHEIIAASSVTTAVEALEANLPADLESERVALVADLAGPFFTRALLAEIELTEVGIDPDSLRGVWLDALAEAGVDDPEMTVDVPASIDGAALDAAVAAFGDTALAIVDDPALITDASVPVTEAYLAGECPDGGTLSGNDVIDS